MSELASENRRLRAELTVLGAQITELALDVVLLEQAIRGHRVAAAQRGDTPTAADLRLWQTVEAITDRKAPT